MLTKRLQLMFLAALCFTVGTMGSVLADVPDSKQHEVQYLLSFVKQSPCVLERNGKNHSGSDAVKHIQKKYDYFRDEIQTAEAFIDYSATKSTMSGRYYKVYCPDKETRKTSEWLLEALSSYRLSHSISNAASDR